MIKTILTFFLVYLKSKNTKKKKYIFLGFEHFSGRKKNYQIPSFFYQIPSFFFIRPKKKKSFLKIFKNFQIKKKMERYCLKQFYHFFWCNEKKKIFDIFFEKFWNGRKIFVEFERFLSGLTKNLGVWSAGKND